MQQQLNMLPPTSIQNSIIDNTPFLTLLSRGSRGGGMADATPPSEGVTLAVLVGGFAAIVWFLVSEYQFLRDRQNSMIEALNTNNDDVVDGEERKDIKKDVSIGDLIDYRLEYFFTSSEWANVILLLGMSYLLVVFGAGLLATLTDSTISEAAWTSWTYVVDPGAQADAPSEFLPRTVSLVVTLGGLLVFALLIGIVGESIGEKLEDLKTGKSRVFESGHTLMLNWNDKVS